MAHLLIISFYSFATRQSRLSGHPEAPAEPALSTPVLRGNAAERATRGPMPPKTPPVGNQRRQPGNDNLREIIRGIVRDELNQHVQALQELVVEDGSLMLCELHTCLRL